MWSGDHNDIFFFTHTQGNQKTEKKNDTLLHIVATNDERDVCDKIHFKNQNLLTQSLIHSNLLIPVKR